MNILLFEKKQRTNDLVCIQQTEKIKHIKDILKLKVGDVFRVGEINGLIGQATIQSMHEHEITFSTHLTIEPPPPLPCSLVIALPRPQQLKRILLHVSSLGIKQIHLIQSARVEKNYWQSPALKQIESYLLEGLEQAQDTQMPKVFQHKSFKAFIEKELPVIAHNKSLWLAHPGTYAYCPKQNAGEHIVFIGPEGGFIDTEVQQLISAGFQGISLGSRILKVETAIPILLAAMFQLP